MPSLSTASAQLLTDLKDLTLKGSNLFSQINTKIVKLKAEGTIIMRRAKINRVREYVDICNAILPLKR
jgi:hypothetical protein